MKKIIIVMVLFVIAQSVNGQMGEGFKHREKALQRIEQMEKIKLIEILELDEETSIKFFARRNEFHNKQKSFMDEREKLLADIEKSLRDEETNDNFYKNAVVKLLELENRIFNERQIFLNSLTNLLSPPQIAKLTVFEFKFRRELTQSLLERGRSSKKN
ncbi:MAG: hypothetical protein AB1521_05350 [Bacteroidota bacterium]